MNNQAPDLEDQARLSLGETTKNTAPEPNSCQELCWQAAGLLTAIVLAGVIACCYALAVATVVCDLTHPTLVRRSADLEDNLFPDFPWR